MASLVGSASVDTLRVGVARRYLLLTDKEMPLGYGRVIAVTRVCCVTRLRL